MHPNLRQTLLGWLIRLQNLIAPPIYASEVARQIAKTSVSKAIAPLQMGEAISILSEIVSESVYRRANIDQVRANMTPISELASTMDASSFMFLLSQALYSYVEAKIIPHIIENK